MTRIPLSRGLFALVDDEDAHFARFRWCADPGRSTYYARRLEWATGKHYKLHRLILGLTDPGVRVDHVNGDGLDCRKANLRIATPQQNGANRRINRTNTSGYKGVARRGQRWRAWIRVGPRGLWLGTFDSAKEAALIYDAAARKHFGAFAALNFPTEGERSALDRVSKEKP